MTASERGAKEDVVLDHEVDGIREYDNPMPGWWKQIFLLTIGFSALYFPYYHLGGGGLSKDAAYAAEMREADEEKARIEAAAPPVTTETIVAIRADATRLGAGRALFEAKCTPCHGPQGGGLVGPNLCDASWLHGKGRLLDIYGTIKAGVPEKGMISWGTQLSRQELIEVAAFVSTLRGTTPATAKAPQGEPVDGIHD